MQVAIFQINEQFFAISVEFLKTIIKAQNINPVPLVPDEILGLINFQGEIITIFHPGIILDKKIQKFDDENVILIINMTDNNEKFTVGIYCDSIFDIVQINDEQLSDTPADDEIIKKYVQKTIHLKDKNIWLLNMEKMLSPKQHKFI